MNATGAEILAFYNACPMGEHWYHEYGFIDGEDDHDIEPGEEYDLDDAIGVVQWQGGGPAPKTVQIQGAVCRARLGSPMRRPCTKCPLRRDAPLKLWPEDQLRQLHKTCQGDGYGVMFCHANAHLPRQDPRVVPCVGWARVLQFDAIGVRIAALQGRLTLDEIEATDGPELYGSFDEMLEANDIELPPRNLVTPRRS